MQKQGKTEGMWMHLGTALRALVFWGLSGVVLLACSASRLNLPADHPIFQDPERRLYAMAMEKLLDQDYTPARKLFEELELRAQNKTYAALAKLRQGDSLFFSSRYAEATEVYRSFTMKYQGDPNFPYAQFMMARSQFERIPGEWFVTPPAYEFDQSITLLTERELQRFLRHYPVSIYAPKAKEMLTKVQEMLLSLELYAARFYEKKEAWQGVAWRLDAAIERFPVQAKKDDIAWTRAKAWGKLDKPEKYADSLEYYLENFPKGKHQKEAERQFQVLSKGLVEDDDMLPMGPLPDVPNFQLNPYSVDEEEAPEDSLDKALEL